MTVGVDLPLANQWNCIPGTNISFEGDYIDQLRYPILDSEGIQGKELAAFCRRQLQDLGICLLPGFLQPEAIAQMCHEAKQLLPISYHSRVVGNAYLTPQDPNLPFDHARNCLEETALGVIAYDQIPRSHALRKLYEWDPLMDFIAHSVLGREKLYRYADPLGALNISVMSEEDYLRWHFDQTDFVVSLCLQNADSGGDFQYAPFIRSKDNENYDQVKALIMGQSSLSRTAVLQPGTLVLFEGRHSLHRVTRIYGNTPRLVALLGYDTSPNVNSSEHLRYLRYGRSIA